MVMNFIYDRVLLPVADLALHLAATWNEKARASVKGRADWAGSLKGQLEGAPPGSRLLFHAPSVGEFLQGRAVLDLLLDQYPEMVAVVTHFSPSAEKIAGAYKRAAAHGYLPLDTQRNVRQLLEIVNPAFLAFARADVWPNLAEEAHKKGIPAALIAGALSASSGRLSQSTVKFARRRFKSLEFIGAISEEDAARFRDVGADPRVIEVTGDPRFDQTWDRARSVEPDDPMFNAFPKTGWTFVAGSTWPQDEKVILPAFAAIRAKHPEVLMILVPHEPSPERIQSLKRQLAAMRIECATLSELEEAGPHDVSVTLVDRVGALAKLYLLGKAAFVGGSFMRRVHNVMEPACFAMPVIVGPRHKNSHEALMMIKRGGCFPVDTEKAMTELWLKFIEDEVFRRDAGERAAKLVESQRGAAQRTVVALSKRFPGLFPIKHLSR